MNRVKNVHLEGNIPEYMNSVGFFIEQDRLEDSNGLTVQVDFDNCSLHTGASTKKNKDEPVENTPWVYSWEVVPEDWDLQFIEIEFGDEELVLPEGWEVYFISIQPNETEDKVIYAITDGNTDMWLIP